MKKYVFLMAAITILGAASCNKEEATVAPKGEAFQGFFTANIEQTLDTKTTLNASRQTVLEKGDWIKMLVTNNAVKWSDPTTAAVVYGSDGVTATIAGPFINLDGFNYNDGTGGSKYSSSENIWNFVAAYPYDQVTLTDHSDPGKVTFEYKSEYSSYTTGESYIPLIADMSGVETHPTEMNFKHVGGAVRVKLNSVPASAEKITMTVAGKQITGSFGPITNTNAGKAEGTLTAGSSSSSTQTVSLNFGTGNAGNYDFVFPVPTIAAKTDYTFNLYNDLNLIIWSAKATNQEFTSFDFLCRTEMS